MADEDKVNILVVDDVPEKLLTMEAILEELGQNVVCVGSGREALRQLLDTDFAVILLDVNMPDMDGFETASLIRQRKRSESTPIIFVTAFSDETHAFHGYSLGAVDYILTPVVPAILRAKVGVFVELFQKTQQVRRQAEERAALAIAHAAQANAEDAARRAAFLAEATAALSNSLHLDDTLQSLLRAAVPRLADLAGVTVVESSGQPWRSVLAWLEEGASLPRMRKVEASDGPRDSLREALERVLATGVPEQLNGLSLVNPFAETPQSQFHMALVRPLTARGRILGALTLVMGQSGRTFRSPDMALAEELAGRAAVAVDNARLYREIQEGDRRKDEFLAMLGHELRNPLAAIANALEYAQIAGDDPTSAARARDILARQVQMMARLVDDLLDVSRITRGKIELRKEAIELQSAVRRAVATVEPLISARQHELTVATPDRSVQLLADPARLEQILANLLNNAAKYTDPGGQIRLEVDCNGHEVAIHIRDSGVGIPEHLLPHVFEMFMQGDRSLDRAQGGLGIGLTLVRSLVELHGGRVDVLSEGLGHGSDFVVRLPVLAPEAAPIAVETPPQACAPKGDSRRILLIDDNVDLTSTMSALLRMGGHEVTVCCDGPSGIEAATELQPEVILVDIGLPGMNGYEVASRLRQMSVFDRTLLVAVTGYGQADDRRRSREAGFDHHLIKPVFFEALQQLLAGPLLAARVHGVASAAK
jgi:signal transduction histidine kinase/DNA-binding response OmpR family regulator